jgi:hypothetical protein
LLEKETEDMLLNCQQIGEYIYYGISLTDAIVVSHSQLCAAEWDDSSQSPKKRGDQRAASASRNSGHCMKCCPENIFRAGYCEMLPAHEAELMSQFDLRILTRGTILHDVSMRAIAFADHLL